MRRVIDESFNIVYSIKNGGKKIEKALKQTESFIHHFKYDPTGRKKKIFDFVDCLAKGSASFSYHISAEEAIQYLNEDKHVWTNPQSADITSTKSFLELYQDALDESIQIITDLYYM